MKIRFATAADVTGILSLLRQVGQVHHELRPDVFRENAVKYSPSQLLQMLEDPSDAIFVAEEDGALLGHCICLVRDYTYDSVNVPHLSLYIDDLCVDESHRHKGVGQALYQAARQYARRRRCASVTLNVWTDNKNAMAFYESMGMRRRTVGMEQLLEYDNAGKE